MHRQQFVSVLILGSLTVECRVNRLGQGLADERHVLAVSVQNCSRVSGRQEDERGSDSVLALRYFIKGV